MRRREEEGGTRREGEDAEKDRGSAEVGDGREGKKDLGRGKNKPHQRVYKVTFTSLRGVTWSSETRFLFFFILFMLVSSSETWMVTEVSIAQPDKGSLNLIGGCTRTAGEHATRLLGHDLIFILALHNISDRTAANLLCSDRRLTHAHGQTRASSVHLSECIEFQQMWGVIIR